MCSFAFAQPLWLHAGRTAFHIKQARLCMPISRSTKVIHVWCQRYEGYAIQVACRVTLPKIHACQTRTQHAGCRAVHTRPKAMHLVKQMACLLQSSLMLSERTRMTLCFHQNCIKIAENYKGTRQSACSHERLGAG